MAPAKYIIAAGFLILTIPYLLIGFGDSNVNIYDEVAFNPSLPGVNDTWDTGTFVNTTDDGNGTLILNDTTSGYSGYWVSPSFSGVENRNIELNHLTYFSEIPSNTDAVLNVSVSQDDFVTVSASREWDLIDGNHTLNLDIPFDNVEFQYVRVRLELSTDQNMRTPEIYGLDVSGTTTLERYNSITDEVDNLVILIVILTAIGLIWITFGRE